MILELAKGTAGLEVTPLVTKAATRAADPDGAAIGEV